MNNQIKMFKGIILVFVLALLSLGGKAHPTTFHDRCCHIHFIYSLDKSIWLSPLYPAIGGPTNSPPYFLGTIALLLDSYRRYFDIYLSINQFDLNNFIAMDHQVPFTYNGIMQPCSSFNFGCFWTNLNHPFNNLANALNSYNDHTVFSLVYGIHPLVIFPNSGTWINLLTAINNHIARGCSLKIRFYPVRWWLLWGRRRMLQAQSLDELLKDLQSGNSKLYVNNNGTAPVRPVLPVEPNVDINQGQSDDQLVARAQLAFTGRNPQNAANDPSFRRLKDEKQYTQLKSKLKNAGAQIEEQYIESEQDLEAAIKKSIQSEVGKSRNS